MRRRIIPIVFFTVTAISIIISTIYNITGELKQPAIVSIIIWFIISMIIILVMFIELFIFKKLLKKSENNIENSIDICEKMLKKCFTYSIEQSAMLTLYILYLRNNDLSKTKLIQEELIKNKIIEHPHSLYNNYILALYDNDFQASKKYYEKIIKLKNKKYLKQIEATKALKIMIDTKKYNQKIYDETSFEVVKVICLRYKNNQ